MTATLLILDRPHAQMQLSGYAMASLGPWCALAGDPLTLAEHEPSPYPSPEAIEQARLRSFQTAQDLLDRLMVLIPRALQEASSLPSRFWEVFLFPYVVHIAGIVEDTRVRCRVFEGCELTYGAPLLNEVLPPPQNIGEYLWQCSSPSALRLKVMDACLRSYLPVSGECPVRYQQVIIARPQRPVSLSRAATAVLLRLSDTLSRFIRTEAVLWDTYSLDWVDLFWLASIGVMPLGLASRCGSLPQLKADPVLRKTVFGALPDPYSSVLESTFPVLALEGLNLTLEEAQRSITRLSRKPRRLYTFGQVWMHPEPIRAAAALLAAEDTEIISIQHGGGLGVYLSSPHQSIECRLADRFLSWGWHGSSQAHPRTAEVIPLPSIALSRLKFRPPVSSRWKILLLVYTDFLYPKWLFTPLFPDLAADYFRREKVLLEEFRTVTPSAVKLFPYEYGWGQNDWIRRAYPELEPLVNGMFTHWARWAELCVVDHNSTGFLELLAMGRPFMATWNRRWYRGQPTFERHLNNLKEVGIFFERPEELVRAYGAIRGEVGLWWNNPSRRDAVEAMATEFAWASPDYRSAWQRFIRSGEPFS